MEVGALDSETLLRAVDGPEPEGADLEHEPEFVRLQRIVEGQPERQLGNLIQPAVPPEWPDVLDTAVELFHKTKDIRVARDLCRALVAIDGLPGLALGLEVFHGLVERYWPGLHPRLDPEDNDPFQRVNIINELADPGVMLRAIRDSVVVAARETGRFTLRQVLAASAPNAPANGPDPAAVEATFAASDPAALRRVAEAAGRALALARGLQDVVSKQVNGSDAPKLSPLIDLLREASAVLAARSGLPPDAKGGGDREAPPPGQPDAGAGSVRTGGAGGPIATPDDVVRAIDRICEYYAKAEPSSPVPLILQRARRLVGKSFLELLSDLTPEAVAQFETISGTRRDK